MKRSFYLYLFLFSLGLTYSQNNARFFSVDGSVFTIYMNDRAVNKTAEASVLLEKLKQDTLSLKVEFENNTKYNITIYLLEKGLPTANKEFNYTLRTDKNKIDVTFTGVYDILPLPDPIVPKKIQPDTSAKNRNTVFEHLCEIKDNTAFYFNNLPKEGTCLDAMPDSYLNYTGILLQRAQTADRKYTVLENVCRNNCLSVSQLKTLLAYSDYELDRLKLVRLAYFNLVNVQNQKELEKSFRLEASVNELNNFFKNSDDYKIRAANACVKASPEEEITKLAESLSVYSNDSQRLNALKKAHDAYCFSVKQTIAVLQKFLHDREKLEAAKLLYSNSVEKEKYSIVADVFSYAQSSAELKNFVEKQTR